MAYTISLDPAAARELKKLDPRLCQELGIVISALADDPRPPRAKKLIGSASSYRIRVRDHRILYRITDRELLVLVVRIGNRRDVYRE